MKIKSREILLDECRTGDNKPLVEATIDIRDVLLVIAKQLSDLGKK